MEDIIKNVIDLIHFKEEKNVDIKGVVNNKKVVEVHILFSSIGIDIEVSIKDKNRIVISLYHINFIKKI